jgi:hypothetical protein
MNRRAAIDLLDRLHRAENESHAGHGPSGSSRFWRPEVSGPEFPVFIGDFVL